MFYLKCFIEWVFPNIAWKKTHALYFTTYYLPVRKVGKLTGRVMIQSLAEDWHIGELPKDKL